MSVVRPIEERLIFEYDTERLALIHAALVRLPPVTITLEGGPVHGWRHEFEVQPDLVLVPGHGGCYAPVLGEETTYLWVGGCR